MTITIRTDVPPPLNPRWYGFAEFARRALKQTPEGGSFDVPDDAERITTLRVASELRIGIVTQKINGGGYRIWRKGAWVKRRRGRAPTT